jgi:ribonuclease HII
MRDKAAGPSGGEERPELMEVRLTRAGFRLIAGIDEAGRGPLAGPVTAAAVILPPGFDDPGIRDSKKCTALERDRLYGVVTGAAVAWAVGEATPEEIDRRNIRRATFCAMRRALEGLPVEPDFILVDGWDIPDIEIKQLSMFRGEQKSRSIAAASIVAKVTRDRKMVEYDNLYPGYGFKKHKGYGTREHMDAIRELGPLSIHRLTFARVREYVPADGSVR